MTLSILDRRLALFAVFYFAIGLFLLLPFWETILVPARDHRVVYLWPLAFPLWGYTKGSALAGEAGGVAGALVGIALVPVALILLSMVVDRLLPK